MRKKLSGAPLLKEACLLASGGRHGLQLEQEVQDDGLVIDLVCPVCPDLRVSLRKVNGSVPVRLD